MISRHVSILHLGATLVLAGCVPAPDDDDFGSLRFGVPSSATSSGELAETDAGDDHPVLDCGSGYCVDDSFCDECACYAVDTLISQAACAQGLIDPSCGIGECIYGGYCDGPNCPDALCYEPDAAISQLMCQTQVDDGGDDWTFGYCAEGAFCDDASCLAQDAPTSVSICQNELVDDCGPGYCIDDAFCDDCACYTPDAPISLAKCQGISLANAWTKTIKLCPWPYHPVYMSWFFVGCAMKRDRLN